MTAPVRAALYLRVADKRFVRIRPVNLGCIEECDASFERGANGLNALAYVRGRPVVGADAHATSSNFRDFQISELSLFHSALSSLFPRRFS
jgi:hypothetical protein